MLVKSIFLKIKNISPDRLNKLSEETKNFLEKQSTTVSNSDDSGEYLLPASYRINNCLISMQSVLTVVSYLLIGPPEKVSKIKEQIYDLVYSVFDPELVTYRVEPLLEEQIELYECSSDFDWLSYCYVENLSRGLSEKEGTLVSSDSNLKDLEKLNER